MLLHHFTIKTQLSLIAIIFYSYLVASQQSVMRLSDVCNQNLMRNTSAAEWSMANDVESVNIEGIYDKNDDLNGKTCKMTANTNGRRDNAHQIAVHIKTGSRSPSAQLTCDQQIKILNKDNKVIKTQEHFDNQGTVINVLLAEYVRIEVKHLGSTQYCNGLLNIVITFTYPCVNSSTSGLYRCSKEQICINNRLKCNGVENCLNHDTDEPESCVKKEDLPNKGIKSYFSTVQIVLFILTGLTILIVFLSTLACLCTQKKPANTKPHRKHKAEERISLVRKKKFYSNARRANEPVANDKEVDANNQDHVSQSPSVKQESNLIALFKRPLIPPLVFTDYKEDRLNVISEIDSVAEPP